MNRILRAAPVAVLIALCVGGCGAPTANAAPAPTSTGDAAAQSTAGAQNLAARIAPAVGPADDAQFCGTLLTIAQSFQQPRAGQPVDLLHLPPSVLDGWSQVAAIAPPEIKSDADVVADRLHKMNAGSMDQLAALRDLAPAIRHVVTYSTEHCPGLTQTAR